MKTLFLFALGGLLLVGSPDATAQKKPLALLKSRNSKAVEPPGPKTVPPAVRVAFSQRFPDAAETRWDRARGDYEATFRQNGSKVTALYDALGHLLEVEREVAFNKLPAGAKDYLVKTYPRRKVKEASRIEEASGAMTWSAKVDGRDLLFDNTGHFLRVKARPSERITLAER